MRRSTMTRVSCVGGKRAYWIGVDRRPSTRGLTLVEMLVSMVITLMMLLAIVQVFAMMGDGVNAGRATIEMAGQLRQATHLLQQDLDSLTCRTLPWARSGSGGGYFEYLEGSNFDVNAIDFKFDPKLADPWVNVVGDVDDVLMFTVRSKGEPFVFHRLLSDGSIQTLESPMAEIAWFTIYNAAAPFNDLNGNGTYDAGEPRKGILYRRVLPLLLGTAGGRGFTLDDLTLRQNRFAHNANFPHEIRLTDSDPNIDDLFNSVAASNVQSTTVRFGGLIGEDVVLSNVLSFDVRAYDPQVPEVLAVQLDTVLSPQELVRDGVAVGNDLTYTDAYQSAGTNYRFHASPFTYGAYVNLRHGSSVGLFRQSPAQLRSGTAVGLDTFTWDTWPDFYERDGVDQDGQDGVDQGTNGIDDDSANGVDDPGERETSPPYPYPLRGIQVRIRVIEPDTGQVRQATIVADFVPG